MSLREGAIWRRKGSDMEQTHHQQHHNPIVSSDSTKITAKEKDHESCRSNKKRRHGLASYKDLPDYMKDNEFILNYYRLNWPLKDAFFSVFRWHNETLNVWTHLIGFVLFSGLTLANSVQVPQLADLLSKFTRPTPISSETNISLDSKSFLRTTNLIDLNRVTPPVSHIPTSSDMAAAATRWPFYVFLSGSMFCLLSSSTCHLFSCHSHRLNILLLRMDYVGIAVMIITSFFPPIYYIFQCNSHWQFIYLGGITAMGIFTIVTLLAPSLSSGKYRAFRALLFASMGLFGLVPAVHATVINWSNPNRNITLGYESAMALFYLTGTFFYVSRIPERWKPGCFDLAGHSHQIFHVLVVMGALAHYGATLLILEWRDKVGC